MTTAGEQPAAVRRARPEDVEGILDLLTHYDLPRSHFEPLYYDDPTYRVDQSWVAERGGMLVAHIRAFEREVRIGGHPLRIAGIGNVVTAREERGQGHAAKLLEGLLSALSGEGVPYSLLWTHVPQVYARHGWVPIREELVSGHSEAVDSIVPASATVGPRDADDLAQIMSLYDEANGRRTGPFVRSREYWQAQSAWLGETPPSFLVARSRDGELAGYLRTPEDKDKPEFLELAIRADDLDVGRALLAYAGQTHGSGLRGPLPPSLLGVFSEKEREVIPDPGLMGRVVNLTAFVKALSPLFSSRMSPGSEVLVYLSTAGGSGTLRVTDHDAELLTNQPDQTLPHLNEEELADLLFHGYRDGSHGQIQNSQDLRTLFPPQDFVIWTSDRF